MRNDSEQEAKEIKMTAGGWLKDYRFYECEVTLTEGLYWYSFRYTSGHGEFCVTKTETSLGIVSRDGADWQQTVYAKDYKTPDWLAGGIIYQIFPDRFYSSGTEKQNVPQDRYLCEDWEKQPEFRQPKEKRRLGNDYYSGDLKGIEQKLDYIKSLGVSCIYLNPIFEAHSNHRYNTADYFKIDPLLGTEEDLCSLVGSAKKRGIGIVLDGVFSHTGDDSVYFNRYGRYDTVGAYQSKESPYYKWFNFTDYPNKYEAWWGILTLPETNENEPSYLEFITGEKGVLRYWLDKGIKGWRLDVADELPDEFLFEVRKAIKAEGEENFLLGEVWEDASNKISYGKRRCFLRGRQLDSVMNYPFAEMIIGFLKGGDAAQLINKVLDITENYPPQATKLLMNHIGTHDTARILTRLGNDDHYCPDREVQAKSQLSGKEYAQAVKLLKLAAVLQYTLPGVPSLYYGDEVGMTGCGDPFCRATYPWGKENLELLEFYKALGAARRGCKAFADGDFLPLQSGGGVVCYMRKSGESIAVIAVNRTEQTAGVEIPVTVSGLRTIIGTEYRDGKLILPPYGYVILEK